MRRVSMFIISLCSPTLPLSLVYFLMFLNILSNSLPKCKAAHSIRQSYLYGRQSYLYEELREEPHIYDKISTTYPLEYYRVRHGHTVSFYYNKNNLISYYLITTFKLIPLYNYLKNDYENILSYFDHNFWLKKHHYVCVVRAPNRRVYLLGTGRTSIIIANVGKGSPLREYKFSKNEAYLFHSMPIANSFVLIISRTNREILINVFDLIEETSHVQTYTIEKIVKAILSQLEENDKNYEELKTMGNWDKLYFNVNATNSIDTGVGNLVFYDKYIVNISLRFKNIGKVLEDVISIVTAYQNKELTVSLQINTKIKVKASRHIYEIDFGSNTVLMSNKYKIDSKYNISQSHLYSVMASAGDYTIIREPIMPCKDKYCNALVLYYKGERSTVFKDNDFSISNLGDIMFIKFYNRIFHNKKLVFVNKNWLNNLKKINKHYIIASASDFFDIIDAEFLKRLVLDRIHNNNTKWVGIDVSDKIQQLSIGDKLTEMVRRFDCPSGDCRFFRKEYYIDPNGDYQFFNAMYHIDYEAEEVYFFVYFKTLKKVAPNLIETKGYRIYLLKAKIGDLINGNNRFRLVWKFENDVLTSQVDTILRTPEQVMTGDCRKLLRLLGNKWNTGNGFINLKVFNMCDKGKAYYDYKYSRRSISRTPTNTAIVSTLHLVRRIVQTF